ncbi:YhgE/Pip family protein [Mobilicoccus pelagius]|uniref:Putative ABC transporter permease protein n=1 Tax=Mobilicoccus pelagius NBRC 104925 TaxID=1089455 RepID=H5UPX5_9MICO|nr:YhgE/Pip domain-containing protein [Mobilicoccus pelagius]GAB47780.1 putative ABC transporter permease protein [Mobilicoccus pelagius NBRC 104925]
MLLKRFLILVKHEFTRFRGRSRLALLFVLLIPLLYGGIYLHANWDLYGHIKDIKVAVVNHDKPATFGDKRISGGKDFVNALKERPQFDWQFLGEDDQKALDGLRDGDYYMIITIPEDFSENLVSAGDFTPKRAGLELRRDDANGFIVGTLTGKADDALGKTLDATVSETYFQALFVNVDKMRQGLVAAADGAKKLDTNLAKAADGVHQLDTAVTAAVDDNRGVQKSVDAASRGITQVEKGGDRIADGVGTAGKGAEALTGAARGAVADVRRVNDAARPLVDFAEKDIPKVLAKSKDLVDVTGTLTGPSDGSVLTVRRQVDVGRDSVRRLGASHPELADDPDYVALTRSMDGALESTTEVESNLGVVARLSGGINADLDPARLQAAGNAVKSAVATADNRAAQIDSGLAQVENGLGQAQGGVADLRAGARQLGSAGRGMTDKATKALSGLVELSNALGRLDTAMPQLSSGAHDLAGGLAKGVAQVPALSEDQRANLSSVMAQPVDIHQTVDHDAKFYGRGLAPMFFSIALWIACVSTFLVLRTISGRALLGRAGAARRALLGFGAPALVGTAGALLMGAGVWLFLGLDPVHPVKFWLLLVVASLAFMALAYWIRLVLGSPQTAVFLVLLILQLPACGGVFPTTMLNPFYQALSVVSPMKYSVDAFRVAISGGQDSHYWVALGVLGAILAVSLGIIGFLVHRKQRFGMRDLHPPMVTSTSTADYAFSVHPR